MAGAFSKHRFQIYNQNQHPYKHNLAEFAYSSNGLPGVTNVEEAMNWLIATIYPLTQSAVALKTDLPVSGVVTFSGAGVLQSAPAAFSVGDLIFLTTTGTLPPSYSPNVVYKILSKTGAGVVLGQQDGTPITFVAGGSGTHTINSVTNAFRVVFDDGDGKAAAYRWEKREGDVSPTWYKIYDMDWSQDSILAQFQNVTQDLYAYKKGKDDTDSLGTPLAGLLSGQHIYGGASSGTNLTLHANAGDVPGVHSGEILLDDAVAPTATNLFDVGTIARRFKALYLSLSAQVSTLNIASGLITDSTGLISFDNENLITTGNVSATNIVATGIVSVAADITISSGLITSASGLISFSNENLITSGAMAASVFGLPLGSSVTENVGGDLLLASSSGTTNFSGDDLTNIGVLTAAALAANSAIIGNLSFNANEIFGSNLILPVEDISFVF